MLDFFFFLLTVSDCKNDDNMLNVPLGKCLVTVKTMRASPANYPELQTHEQCQLWFRKCWLER